MKFQVGKIYPNGNGRVQVACVARTAKTVTFEDVTFKAARVKIHVSDGDGDEIAYPFGVYSQCPVVRASRFAS